MSAPNPWQSHRTLQPHKAARPRGQELKEITREGEHPQVAEERRNSGAPGEIRTPDLLLRRQSLYPAELRARF